MIAFNSKHRTASLETCNGSIAPKMLLVSTVFHERHSNDGWISSVLLQCNLFSSIYLYHSHRNFNTRTKNSCSYSMLQMQFNFNNLYSSFYLPSSQHFFRFDLQKAICSAMAFNFFCLPTRTLSKDKSPRYWQ